MPAIGDSSRSLPRVDDAEHADGDDDSLDGADDYVDRLPTRSQTTFGGLP